MELVKFESWPDVMAHAKAGRPLYYQAPMDHRATRFLPGSKQTFTYAAQGRTVRLWPPGSVGRGKNRTADPFNADSKHLERFSRPAEQKVESSGVGIVSERHSASPLSGQRKEERDKAVAQAVETARRSGEEQAVWMNRRGEFQVELSSAAPWEKTIAIAYPNGSVSYKRYGASEHKVASRRQPSLPGFPDVPDTLEIRIPKMPMWEQVGGDMDPGAHGGILARSSGDAIELMEIQPVRAHIGDGEAAEVGFPFWTKTAYYDLSDLDPNDKDVKSALRSSGFEDGDQRIWFEEEATPEQRAIAIAESLLSYGVKTDEGDSGWAADIIHEDVKWMSGKIAGSEYIADEDEEFKNDVLGYSDIREKLEEMVEWMADQSAATSRSTLGDRDVEDAERDGYDPDSLVCVAAFGDAVAVNGDLESEKTEAGVEADLEKEGYEMLDNGGSIPDTEEHVSPEHAIRAVARDMDIEEDVVKEAAEGIEWWPKGRNEEIASSTSGTVYTWGKKDPHAHVEDGDYVVQGAYSDGTIVGGLGGGGGETFSLNDEQAAIQAAKDLLRDLTFEGDYVTVITRDGELVWSSNPDEGGKTEEPRRALREATETLPVIFRAERSGDHKGEVTAVFPTLPGTGWQDFTVYAHVGQHSTGTIDWYTRTRAATPAEYASLLAEIRRIYEQGQDPVKLRVVERFSKQYDDERRANARR